MLGVNPGAFINGLTVLTRLRELVLAEFKALLFGVINVVMTAIGVRISAK